MNNSYAAQSADGAPLLSVDGVSKAYRTPVLRDITLELQAGDSIAVVGPSGAGKSTLLNIIGTLDHPTTGRVLFRGDDLFALDAGRQARFRNRKLGFIFQFHHLLPELTALENTVMPALISGEDRATARQRARRLLELVHLESRMGHKPGELSGGEQQRVAVARALVMQPELVLADEPTGNLDTHSGRDVFDLLVRLNHELQTTLVVVTHNLEFARLLPRRIQLIDGVIVEDRTDLCDHGKGYLT